MGAIDQSPITIRAATLEDATHVAKLGSYVFNLTFGHTVTPEQMQEYLDEAYTTEAITEDILNPLKDLIVATNNDGIIVGFALLTQGTSEPCIEHFENIVELQRIYVHPDYHGKGIGKILAVRIETMAREQGFKHIWLGVWEENHTAQKLYGKLGYVIVGDHDFIVGGDVQTDHIMTKPL